VREKRLKLEAGENDKEEQNKGIWSNFTLLSLSSRAFSLFSKTFQEML